MRCGVVVVDQLFQLFARLEIGDTLGRDAYRIAGLWVSATPRAALAHAEAAEAAQFDLLTLIQGLDDALKDNFD